MWASAISGVYDMKGIKRVLLALLFTAVITSALAAAPRLYIGLNLTYDVNRLTRANQDEIEGMLAGLSGDYPAYHNNGKWEGVSALHGLGPKFEIVIFPFEKLPLGIGISSTTLLTIGYMTDSGENVSYFSRELDFRQDFGAGLYYQQAFGPTWGLFTDCSLVYSFYRMATTNVPNSKPAPVCFHFDSWGVNANLGAYLEYSNSFFKVGANLYYDLASPADFSFRYGLILGGGLRI